jgi:hypothetical protein
MCVIVFTNQGFAFLITVPKGKSVKAKFYLGKVLHKLKKNVDQQMVSVLPSSCMTMLRQTKRPLYEII